MGKQDFIDELRNSLDKEVSATVIEENVRYYSGYIDEQLSKGKTMEDIESEIGRGSVVARSIIEAEEHKKNSATYKDDNSNYSQKNSKAKNYSFNVNTWYGKLLGILLLILVVVIVIAIIGILVALAWYVVIPVLALGAVIYIIVKLVTEIKG